MHLKISTDLPNFLLMCARQDFRRQWQTFCEKSVADSHSDTRTQRDCERGGSRLLTAGLHFPRPAVAVLQCVEEGKVSDYGASKPEGKNILKYVLEYEEGQCTLGHHSRERGSSHRQEESEEQGTCRHAGHTCGGTLNRSLASRSRLSIVALGVLFLLGYYYLFKNDSKELHLDAELEFNMSNLAIVGFEAAVKVKVSLPPGSLQYVHLRRVDPTLNCNCEITQRFALVPARPGKLPLVYVPVTYTCDTPIEVLRAQTEKEGTCTDHGAQDPAGLLIHQYQWVTQTCNSGGAIDAVPSSSAQTPATMRRRSIFVLTAAPLLLFFPLVLCARPLCVGVQRRLLLPVAQLEQGHPAAQGAGTGAQEPRHRKQGAGHQQVHGGLWTGTGERPQ